MELSNYYSKHVRVKDRFGGEFIGVADYHDAEYCLAEYGTEENAVKIGEDLIYESEVASIEELEVHGTAEIWTDRLVLRRHRPEDAEDLYRYFGADPEMTKYSGWNPYVTLETARQTVRRFIESCRDEHFYGWAIECEDVLFGTIGAYDYENDRIEVGFSIIRACWGRGYATEALKAALSYLTENEGISCVTAWCAAENIASRRVLEKAGMQLVRTEKDGLAVGEKTYDRLIFEYRRKAS